ncbi:MAG: hypothetical protein ABR568_01260 [Pyrinomonadaceae bacterium]
MKMTEEQADGLKRVVTFVGSLVLTFAVGITLWGIMLFVMLPD